MSGPCRCSPQKDGNCCRGARLSVTPSSFDLRAPLRPQQCRPCERWQTTRCFSCRTVSQTQGYHECIPVNCAPLLYYSHTSIFRNQLIWIVVTVKVRRRRRRSCVSVRDKVKNLAELTQLVSALQRVFSCTVARLALEQFAVGRATQIPVPTI